MKFQVVVTRVTLCKALEMGVLGSFSLVICSNIFTFISGTAKVIINFSECECNDF